MNSYLQQLIDDAAQQLEKISDAPKQEAWWILQAITKKTMLQIMLDQKFELTEAQEEQFDEAICNRVEHEMPLQYILGQVPFCGLPIAVEPPTLIPRPETEEWTQWLIKALESVQDKKITVLDLCTGSGCIAVTLAKNFPHAEVLASDISEDALMLAQKNKELNQVKNLAIINSDLFSHLPQDTQKFDLIVSNPPYLSFEEWKNLDYGVIEWEDARALAAGKTGLEFYQKIISQAQQHLKSLSKEFIEAKIPRIVLEFGINQAEAIADLLQQHGFKEICVYNDMSGKKRWITAQ